MEKYHEQPKKRSKERRKQYVPIVVRLCHVRWLWNTTQLTIHHKQPASEHVESMVENIRETKLEIEPATEP